ncbi:MAG: peroxidase [Calditrichaeota bacterium]|nr:MAG: peroxidase [Calditrichota bacterium]
MEAIKTDFRKAPIDRATLKMLEFVEKVTLHAYRVKEEDVRQLKEIGFKDEDILDMVHITGYFNHINRLADALGVDLEDFMIKT